MRVAGWLWSRECCSAILNIPSLMKPTRTDSPAEIARAFALHVKTVRRYAAQGCPHDRDGAGRMRFDPAEVRRWMSGTGRDGRPGRPDGGGTEVWTDADREALDVECPDLLDASE